MKKKTKNVVSHQNDSLIPLEANFDWVNGVAFDKGCYLGQETVAKLASRGGVKQQLRCWTSTDAEAATLRVGDQLSLSGQRAGVITGVAPEPSTAGGFGLALVRRQALDAEALQAGSDDVTISLKRPDAFCAPPTPS